MKMLAITSVRRPLAILLLVAFLLTTVIVPITWYRIIPSQASSTIVVVVLDTVGYRSIFNAQLQEDAPFIHSLAASSASFSRAFSVAPWTKPAIASILTGVYPSTHGVRHPRSRIRKDVPTMAEIFSGLGYATGGVVSHVFLAPKTSYRRGFDSYELTSFSGHVHDSITASQVTDRGLAWLQKAQQRGTAKKLLFLHYFDPHYNYRHHPRFDRTSWYNGSLHDRMKFEEFRARATSLSEEDIRYIKGLYKEEVLATDAELKRLYEGLKKLGLSDVTLVLTADHGEAFKDHNHLGHGHFLYNELVRVPLIFHAPGRIKAQQITRTVSTMDILPTLLEMVGEDKLTVPMHGVSFLGLLDSASVPPTPIRLPIFEVKYHSDRTGVVYWPWKAIRDNAAESWRYYNLERDPHEQQPLVPELVPSITRARSESAIREYIASEKINPRAVRTEEITYSPDELNQLKTLGYAM